MRQGRVAEITDQDLALVKSIIDPLTIPIRRACKKVIGTRGQNRKTKPGQLMPEPVTGGADACDTLAEVLLVLECGHHGNLGQAIKVVVVADLVEGSDNVRPGYRQAEPARE